MRGAQLRAASSQAAAGAQRSCTMHRGVSLSACSTSGRALEQCCAAPAPGALTGRRLRARRQRARIVSCAADAEAAAPGPMTEEELRALSDREAQLQEQAIGDAWRSQFEGDLEGLYDYVGRCALRALEARAHRATACSSELFGRAHACLLLCLGCAGHRARPLPWGPRCPHGECVVWDGLSSERLGRTLCIPTNPPTSGTPGAANPGTSSSGWSRWRTRSRCRAPCASARARCWGWTACRPAWPRTSWAWATGGSGVSRRRGGGGGRGARQLMPRARPGAFQRPLRSFAGYIRTWAARSGEPLPNVGPPCAGAHARSRAAPPPRVRRLCEPGDWADGGAPGGRHARAAGGRPHALPPGQVEGGWLGRGGALQRRGARLGGARVCRRHGPRPACASLPAAVTSSHARFVAAEPPDPPAKLPTRPLPAPHLPPPPPPRAPRPRAGTLSTRSTPRGSGTAGHLPTCPTPPRARRATRACRLRTAPTAAACSESCTSRWRCGRTASRCCTWCSTPGGGVGGRS